MSEQTTHLALPYILPSQAQKHVTHNEALQRLDAVVQLIILSASNMPPATPEEGACHAVLSAPTGAWAGKAGRIAFFQDGAWMFITPRAGWTARFVDTGQTRIWSGSSWLDYSLTHLGIQATPDDTNRLSLSAEASLFNHAGHDHRIKINKSDDTDTASLLYQTGFSGRAEMGLTGSDDFEIKVSADGVTWATAFRCHATGAVSFPGRPLVRASLGETDQTPADATRTGFATLHHDQGGFALGATVPSGTGSRLLVPVSGYYQVTLNVSVTDAASYAVAVQRNGTTDLLTIRDGDTGSASYSQSASTLAFLDEGDWIGLMHSGTAEYHFGYGKTELVMVMV